LNVRMSTAHTDEEQAEAAASAEAEAEAEAEAAHERCFSADAIAGFATVSVAPRVVAPCITAKPDNIGLVQEPASAVQDAEASVHVSPSEVPPCRFFGGRPAFNFMPPCRGTAVGSSIQMPSNAVPNDLIVFPPPACDAVGSNENESRSWAACATQAASATVGATSTCGPGLIAEVAIGTEPQQVPTSPAQGVRALAAQCSSASRGHIPAARGARPASYVVRSRECLARWRRERQELRSKQRHLGLASASGGQPDCMRRPSTAPASLEVRGVALPLHVRSTT